MQTKKKIDLSMIIIPSIIMTVLSLFFFLLPKESTEFFANIINPIFRNKFGLLYLATNLMAFILAIYFAFSKLGKITLGEPGEKPAIPYFAWASMMFCCGLGGDMLFYQFTEWLNYSQEPYIQSLGNAYDFSNAYSMFFWGNYWIYLVPAVCLAFMIHVRKNRKQKFSECLRPLFGKHMDGPFGKIVDMFTILILLCLVAVSIGLTMPMVAECIANIIGIQSTKGLAMIVMLVCAAMYLTSVNNGLKGIEILSKICVYLYIALLAFVLLFGGKFFYILESSFKQIGLFLNNLIPMFTDIDATHKTSFVADYCVYYDACWVAYMFCVPFFIAMISRGRKIKDVILGGMVFGFFGGILGFAVISNYAMSQQVMEGIDIIGIYNSSDMYNAMAATVKTLPLPGFVFGLLVVTMLTFAASTYDSVALTLSYFSYKDITVDEQPPRFMRSFWAVILTLFPLTLTFAEISYDNLQNVAVFAGFPAAIIFIFMVISFVKDAGKYMNGRDNTKLTDNAKMTAKSQG